MLYVSECMTGRESVCVSMLSGVREDIILYHYLNPTVPHVQEGKKD